MTIPSQIRALVAGALLAGMAGTSHADSSPAFGALPNSAGVTGLLNVPTADTMPEGTLTLGWSTYAEPSIAGEFSSLDRALFTVGLFDYLEIGGQFNRANLLGTSQRGLKDLSFGAKLHLPGIPSRFPQIAVGVDDYGGEAPHFRSRYAVTTYALGPVSFTAGYGEGPERLKGAFGGASLSLPWGLQLTLEHDSENPQAGVRWVSPPWRESVRVHAGLLYTDREDTRELSTAVGLIIHLPQGPTSLPEPQPAAAQAVARVPEPAISRQRPRPPPPPAEVAVKGAPIPAGAGLAPRIAAALGRAGFRAVSVRESDSLIEADAENSLYRVNELDAVGVGLGIMAREAGCRARPLRLVLRREGLALAQLNTRADRMLQLVGDRHCVAAGGTGPEVELLPYQGGSAVAGGEVASVGDGRPWDLSFYPRLAYRLGTEVASFDYSLALDADLRIPLWQGATLGAVVATSPVESKNFRDGRIFADYSLTGGLQSAVLQQAFTPGWQSVWQLGVGLLTPDLEGGLLEGRWVPGNGTHVLGIRGAYAEDQSDGERRHSLLGSYELSLPGRALGARLLAGQFLYDDHGVGAELYRDFSDVRVTVFGVRTEQTQVGLRFRVPLSPRRASAVGPVVIRGSDSWSNQIRTTVDTGTRTNPMFPDMAREIQLDASLEKVLANNGRWSQAYLDANLGRLREAYARYQDGEAAVSP